MSQKLHLALLVCDTPKQPVVDKYGDYPYMFAEVFDKAREPNVDITWEHFDVVHAMQYPSLEDLKNHKFDGIVITGSAYSAYENDEWILKLVDFVKLMRTEPYRSTVRIIGVCFGHQILARSSGGVCEKNKNGWERLNQVHQDHIPDLPDGFHSLATTAPHTAIHALVSDDNQCLTIQGHPEYKRGAVEMLLKIRQEAGILTKEFAEEQLEKLRTEGPEMEDIWLIQRFIDFLLGKLAVEPKDYVDPDTGNPSGPNVKIGND
ncbi:class I glutamine amidotransferase-like protein [Radiomyces spectabilis]|uniref:class I glutamine amidotransferase-like protein n=1 Tax=Radiomyces spectabilis TaxID=64574 RepID=UPI002220F9C7|nr:class I glutamine amidotransferase-like protein [Radiomyces spectabilis]KAI8394324.1 class I glutamine amidotransferase-like protein [Radiomyces spectabilis]